MKFLLALLFIAICVAAHAVDRVVTPADLATLRAVVDASLRLDGSFESLHAAYAATSALADLAALDMAPLRVPPTACAAAEAALLAADRAEEVFYALAIYAAAPDTCGATARLGDAVTQLLSEVLTSSGDLFEVYYASSAVRLLAVELAPLAPPSLDAPAALLRTVPELLEPLAKTDRFIRSLADRRPTLYNSALAYASLANALAVVPASALDEDAQAIADEISDSLVALVNDEEDPESATLSFEGGPHSPLDTTARMFDSIVALAAARGSHVQPLRAEHVSQLAQYFVSNLRAAATAASLTDVAAVARGLRLAVRRPAEASVPLVVTSWPAVITKESSGSVVSVRVSDLLGYPVAPLRAVVLRRVVAGRETAAGATAAAAGAPLSLVPEQALEATADGAFGFDLAIVRPEPGFYSLHVAVERAGLPATSAVRVVKVLTSMSVVDAVLHVSDTASLDEGVVQRLALELPPRSLREPVVVAAKQHVHVGFRVLNDHGAAMQLQQAFLRLTHEATGREVFFVVPCHSAEHQYALRLELGSPQLGAQLAHRSGRYAAALVLGDLFVANPQEWHFASFDVDLASGAVTAAAAAAAAHEQASPQLAVLPELSHTYAAKPRMAPAAVSTLFTGVVLSPLAVLLVALLSPSALGANLRGLPSGALARVHALVFVGALAAAAALLVYYWLALTIFQCLAYLALLAVPLLVSGRGLLRVLLASEE